MSYILQASLTKMFITCKLAAETGYLAKAMFASRRPLLPSFLSFVTVTNVLRYFNIMIFSCRCQAHIANQMVSIFHKSSLLDITSDEYRLSKVFHRELSIILSHVSVTSNDR